METKNKLVKTAKVCEVISKVLYLLAMVATVTFIVLAIALPLTDAISAITNGETAVIFATLALSAFIYIGLFWNIQGVFKTIVAEGTPFTDRAGHYLKKIAIYVIVLSVAPALIGSTVLRIVYPETEIVFPIDLGGIAVGAVVLFLGVYFNHGKELQKRDDETL